MKIFTKLTIIYGSSIIVLLIMFFISGLGSFSQKSLTIHYNNFRIHYSELLYFIESHHEKLPKKELTERLKTEHIELCLYDLSQNNIIYSYGTFADKITNASIENFMVHDSNQNMALGDDSYLMNYVFFHEEEPLFIGIFILPKKLLYSNLYDGQRSLTYHYIGLIFIFLILTIIYIYQLYQKVVLPLKGLEVTTKKIASGNFIDSIPYELQNSSLGSCYVELEHMRKDLYAFSEKLSQNEINRKELVNYLTHDLKTPLASIRALTEGLIDGIASTPEKKERYLKGILNKTNEMEQLANDLFHHANIELNGFSVDKTDCYIDEAMNIIFSSCKVTLESFNGKYTISNTLPHLMGNIDTFRLKQCLINLVTNAMKYSKEENTISLNAYYSDPYFIIEIRDYGMGISKEDIPFIFDPFFRGEKSRSRKYGGTGLGLSIVKQIIDMHQGSIQVKSKLNEGTMFIISIPKG